MMPFKKGDKVRILNETGGGTVAEDSAGKKEVLVLVDGFELPYPVEELVKVEGDKTVFETGSEKSRELLKIIAGGESGSDRKHKDENFDARVFKRRNARGIPEIDLHIHELLDYYGSMNNTEMVAYQMAYLKQVILAAEQKNIKELIIIHGVGEGTLKSEVRDYVDARGDMHYEDAPLRLYGRGATHVILRPRKF